VSALLKAVREDRKLEGVLIVDAHCHMGPWFNFHIPYCDARGMVEVMDSLGVTAACPAAHLSIGPDHVAGNSIVLEAMRDHPGRFHGYATINPNYPEEIEAELIRCKDAGMRCIKLHPGTHKYPADGENCRIVYEFAARSGLPVLLHTWKTDSNCTPALFEKLAAEYPQVSFLLGHSGGGYEGVQESIRVARQRPNVFLETCYSGRFWGRIEMMVNGAGADRVLWGSDFPFLDASAALGEVVYAKVSDAQKEKILGRNMAALLGL